MKTVPARIHVLLASGSSRAVVIRRGPSKQVASILWDRNDDSFELGQWLKGHIYPYRSDLSPDGKHLIYFAMNGHWQSETTGAWTAISRAPYLKALHIYGWGDCWDGGGLFTGCETYWLNSRSPVTKMPQAHVRDKLLRAQVAPCCTKLGLNEYGYIYFRRLHRDGWCLREVVKDRKKSSWMFEKPVRSGWMLEKRFHGGLKGGPNDEPNWETHRLVGPDVAEELVGAEWADSDGMTILFAREGALWRRKVDAKAAQPEVLIRDFNDMVFEAIEAPYKGADIGSGR